jgi:hypothetical protein
MAFDASFYEQEIAHYQKQAKEARSRGDTTSAKELANHARHLDIHAKDLARVWAEHEHFASQYPSVET